MIGKTATSAHTRHQVSEDRRESTHRDRWCAGPYREITTDAMTRRSAGALCSSRGRLAGDDWTLTRPDCLQNRTHALFLAHGYMRFHAAGNDATTGRPICSSDSRIHTVRFRHRRSAFQLLRVDQHQCHEDQLALLPARPARLHPEVPAAPMRCNSRAAATGCGLRG